MSLEVDSAPQTECNMKAIRNGYGLLCLRSMKNISCEYDRRVVEAQLCKLHDASDTLIGRACAIFHLLLEFLCKRRSNGSALLPFTVFLFLFVFRLFHVSPSSLFSLPCSPWWRILFLRLGAAPPPRCLRACKSAYSPCMPSSLLLSCFLLFTFSSLPSLFRFRFGRRFISSCLFLVGTMLSSVCYISTIIT